MARFGRGVGLLALALSASGCFTVEGTLEQDGSGKLQLTYVPPRTATASSETRRLGSAHVTVDSVRTDTKGAVAQLHFDDVTQLSTAEAFAAVTVTRMREGGAEQLRVLVRNTADRADRQNLEKWARDHPEVAGPRIGLTLPGRVLEANRAATVADRHVEWRIPLVDYAREDVIDLEARWAPGGGKS